jgi:Holliday junction resolvase-like predicted endonuclease
MVRRIDPPGADPMPPPAPQPARQIAFRLGLSAESRAAAFLVAKGYRIVARRWRSVLGEVDIVARCRRLLAFVEVKARATSVSMSCWWRRAASRATSRRPSTIAGDARCGRRLVRYADRFLKGEGSHAPCRLPRKNRSAAPVASSDKLA